MTLQLTALLIFIAIFVATTMTALLTRWGMSMVVIGPIVLVGIFVLPGVL